MKFYNGSIEQKGATRSGPKGGKRPFRSQRALLLALVIAAGLIAPGAMNAQTTIGSDGAMVLKGLTLPRGAVWLANNSGGGHWWVSDGVFGFCRVDPAPGSNPPFITSNCGTAAKTSGQAVVANPAPGFTNLPTGAKFVFVPDGATRSVAVVRYVFNPATETVSANLTMQVQNVTSVGGGAGGGRAQAAALAPNGVDLYVGYKASGDIMKVTNATGTTSGTPVVSKIGSTSDGRGVWSLLLFKTDLYLAEVGGNGLSVLTNVAGRSCPPCLPPSLMSQISSFPGGLASDGTYIYVGDAPRIGPNRILRFDPAGTGAVDVYSSNVTTYTATADGVNQSVFTTYAGPIGLGLRPDNGDLYVGDDPSFSFVAPASNPTAAAPTTQGHLWKVTAPVPNAPPPVTVSSIAPTSGPTNAPTTVTITGTGFATGSTTTQVSFGSVAATSVNCISTSSCSATTSGGSGTVDVRVVVPGMPTSPVSAADQFTYVAPPPPLTGGPTISSVSPATGLGGGGTIVTITGTNLSGATAITFGPNAATPQSAPQPPFNCAADGTTCTVVSPAGVGTVDIQVTAGGSTSTVTPNDHFAYAAAGTATLFAFGITAPKGGMVFIPGNQGGHFWSSDHANGFCRQDPVPGTALHAINYAVCDDGNNIGSAGQAVYDKRVNADGTHYIYVPDNAVKSTAVWRLTFDPATETIKPGADAMAPLATNVLTLKPNGMAIGPDGNLYITDLTEPNIRVLTNPNGDPNSQSIYIVAVTGDNRGANGTTGFIQNKFYISENRGATWIDTNVCNAAAAAGGAPPCQTTAIPLPQGVFVAGVATDDVHNMVYASSSAGGSPATVFRYNVTTNTTTSYVLNNSATVPGTYTITPPSTFPCAVNNGCNRPVDTIATSPAMAFAFGLYVDTRDGTLYITEDATAGARSGRGRAFSVPFVP